MQIHISSQMSSREYKCVVCSTTSCVSGNYFHRPYVQAGCCSTSCKQKKDAVRERLAGGVAVERKVESIQLEF